jgi:ubiquinone/menaquinone biosynthesis C-methylase UbiE
MTQDVRASEDAVTHFSETADHYASKHYNDAVRSFMTVRQDRVLELIDGLRLKEGSDVLDAGCGPGFIVEQLARRGFRVSGMDGADGMLRSARVRLRDAAPRLTPDFSRGDIEHLPYADASFDLVVSTGVIEYVTTDSKVLAEFYRVLRPGGHLVLPVTNRSSPVLWLDGAVEFLKRRAWFREPINVLLARLGRRPVLARTFKIRKHATGRFRRSLAAAGFELRDELYFHFLPWPRPMDQIMPKASAALGSRMERLARSRLGILGEGYLTLSAKRG